MNKYTLENGIETVIKNNKNTPRTAFCLFFKLNKDEEIPGQDFYFKALKTEPQKN